MEAVVAEKQAGYVLTNLTLSSVELEIQSMMDVSIHQEDLDAQRTPLIDPVILMTFQEEFRSAGWCKENSNGQKTIAEDRKIALDGDDDVLDVLSFGAKQPKIKTEPPQPEEPEPTLEDEFQDLHINLLVLEVLSHALIYNAILDKYIESLELGKKGSAFVQGEIPTKIEDAGLFTLPCRLGDINTFGHLGLLGSW
ncbi:hypothetical protein Tco_0122954 [Tanacetum coccineum]